MNKLFESIREFFRFFKVLFLTLSILIAVFVVSVFFLGEDEANVLSNTATNSYQEENLPTNVNTNIDEVAQDTTDTPSPQPTSTPTPAIRVKTQTVIPEVVIPTNTFQATPASTPPPCNEVAKNNAINNENYYYENAKQDAKAIFDNEVHEAYIKSINCGSGSPSAAQSGCAENYRYLVGIAQEKYDTLLQRIEARHNLNLSNINSTCY